VYARKKRRIRMIEIEEDCPMCGGSGTYAADPNQILTCPCKWEDKDEVKNSSISK
jgi:hypothetical protein